MPVQPAGERRRVTSGSRWSGTGIGPPPRRAPGPIAPRTRTCSINARGGGQWAAPPGVKNRRMRLTKLGHACVQITEDDRSIVIDPGSFSEAAPALAAADAVLITHEHFDHFDADALRAEMARRPGLEVWTSRVVAENLSDLGGRVHRVGHGDAVTVAGLRRPRVRRGPRAPAPRPAAHPERRLPRRRRGLPSRGRADRPVRARPHAVPAGQRALDAGARPLHLRPRGPPGTRLRHPRRPAQRHRPHGHGTGAHRRGEELGKEFRRLTPGTSVDLAAA